MKLHNIRNQALGYTTFGCVWEKGECLEDASFACRNENGDAVELQSRVTAYWPDGSVKWSAHTANAALLGRNIEVVQEEKDKENAVPSEERCQITEDAEVLSIQLGELTVTIRKNSNTLFESMRQKGKEIFTNAKLVAKLQIPMASEDEQMWQVRAYQGMVQKLTVEEQGPLQVIVKYEGTHVSKQGEEKLPFIVRMTLGRDCSEVHFQHTFLYDGDENRDFLKGLGIRFETPITGALYNRHVKFMNDHGMFHEGLVPLLSWRPRAPKGVYERQMAGECLMLSGEEKAVVDTIMKDTPYWDTYVMTADSASHYGIQKKLADDNCCLIDCLHGRRSKGGCAIGSEYGSVVMAMQDFWEKYPSGYEISGLSTDSAQCTMWFWSPKAEAYDFRHYANRGYNQVCYEGYDYKGATPYGIACTNACAISFQEGVIAEDSYIETLCETVNKPALYVAEPEYYHEKRAFGYWSLPSRQTPMEDWLEQQLEKAADFYLQEVEQRGWYGMFNYGDFMHSYDSNRHQWKYDIGGYAWDNTELVPTLWLWYYFMRTGREDVFSLAEKLSRHASEVDVYHFGAYQGLGSRHNVRHWGCPCKEARIAMAGHHRFLYYLTGDRRFEDIFDELKDNEMSFLNKDPLGDFYEKETMVYPSHARSGPDWSSLCSNWMTQWERTKDETYRQKIVTGLEDIKAAPLQLSSGPDFEFDPKTVHLRYIGERTTGGCHLQLCMGAPEIWMELADLLEDEEFKHMLAKHGRFYYLSHEEQLAESKGLIGNRESTLPYMAAALGAYGAVYLEDAGLAKKTWQILLETLIQENNTEGFASMTLPNCGNQKELVEIPWISTNFAAQWCLNTIVSLEFIREALPKTVEHGIAR